MQEQENTFTTRVLRKKMIPYSITAMVFGIVSIAVFIYFGWVAAIVALVLYNKAIKIYQENPSQYKESSLKMLKAAKITGIIGLIISLLGLLFYFFIFGLAFYFTERAI